MVGNNISMLMPSPYREQHDNYIQNYKDSGLRKIIGIGREVQGKRKNGSVFPFWLSVSEVKMKNQRLFTGIVHDLTEQKKSGRSPVKTQSRFGRACCRTHRQTFERGQSAACYKSATSARNSGTQSR
ncbi:MAG: PAS domain S-box protein [Saprospiraceae bacterium]|nr:PAS domain S-box protein [Saprospiraceae bacterium]